MIAVAARAGVRHRQPDDPASMLGLEQRSKMSRELNRGQQSQSTIRSIDQRRGLTVAVSA